MHFIDRDDCKEAPIELLESLVVAKKEDWASYNAARIDRLDVKPSRPPSSWLNDGVRKPLKKLFLKNCGYCGIHADEGRDAEVDHFFPTARDRNADYVFDWHNYVWSCPKCNGLKSNNYPFLNPTINEDMKHLYFHEIDGRYLLFKDASEDMVVKYDITVSKSSLNGSNRPARRKLVSRNVKTLLDDIRLRNLMYTVDCSSNTSSSQICSNKLQLLNDKKGEFIDLINGGDYLFLVKHLVNEYIISYSDFPYTFEELLDESGYLD